MKKEMKTISIITFFFKKKKKKKKKQYANNEKMLQIFKYKNNFFL